MTFPNRAARRAYFTEELRKKLREIQEDQGGGPSPTMRIFLLLVILHTIAPVRIPGSRTLSRNRNRKNRPSLLSAGSIFREAFAVDVSNSKNDPIYNAHSDHTKVPHKVIMRYIRHHTDETSYLTASAGPA